MDFSNSAVFGLRASEKIRMANSNTKTKSHIHSPVLLKCSDSCVWYPQCWAQSVVKSKMFKPMQSSDGQAWKGVVYLCLNVIVPLCTCLCLPAAAGRLAILYSVWRCRMCLFVCLFVYDCVCVHLCVHWQQQAGVLCSIQFGGRWRRQWTDSPLSRTPPPPHRTSPEPAPAHAGNESNPPKKSQENQAGNKSDWKEMWRVREARTWFH